MLFVDPIFSQLIFNVDLINVMRCIDHLGNISNIVDLCTQYVIY